MDIFHIFKMNFLQRRQFRFALGFTGASAVLYGFYRLWRFLSSGSTEDEANERETQKEQEEEAQEEDEEDHIPFDELIQDKHHEQMCSGRIGHIKYIRDISYRAIFCLMKGSSYHGIVSINFYLGVLTDEVEDFKIAFNGIGLKFLLVNGRRFDPRQIQFIDHCIKIPRQLLREKGKNSIEVIFENSYSFLNEGLSTYFTIDENKKYSLRQQVIYSSNGYLQAEKMIPCINCLNECKVQVEVIHPDTFEVFSNGSKSLERFCSVTEYQKYPFLFDLSSNSLNRSFKLNASSVSAGSIDNSSQYSSSNFYNRKKANTHFYVAKLPSIHNLFIFSSAMLELIPSPLNNPLEEKVMIRYFCKHAESHRLEKAINKLHAYIFETLKKLSENVGEGINKIDVLIISDRESEGHFAPGAIILSEKSLGDSIDIKCLYLVVRALCGIVQLSKGENIVTLEQILALNEFVFAKFEEFRNYLYIVNQQYQKVRKILNCNERKEFIRNNQGYFLKYYSVELRFILLKNIGNSITSEFSNLMLSFKPEAANEFWEKLLSNYNFLSPLIVEPLLEMALQKLGTPSDDRLKEQLKICFNSSRYVLSFYTNQEISDNLPKFIEYQAEGLEERLTQLKVKQKFKDFITERYEKYLPVKSNIAEAEAIYNQFKKFNQAKNFHHFNLLESQISRVVCFGTSFVRPDRISSQCSVSAWKLLSRLKIFPSDESYYQFLRTVDDIQQV